ncbi:sialic acid-binding Ig-like lectin 13 [Ctenopharyngodon idella]|uniref:sialic acid-binding Ig-like lectin 13 n=1 Tax=Ctenopharyngodon idella TaxID=7959 RepID=UPI00222FA35A|nr:sialic acid-binding Ig-like lectin 13 [Ctenopharyngodon idella]
MYMMEIFMTFLLTGCLIQGVFCGFSISLPERVEALEGSCVFIPCTFNIEQQYEQYLTDVKRIWYKDKNIVFDSSRSDTGLLRGEIFGTPTEKNCTTHFDNVEQKDNGSYSFRLEAKVGLKHNFTNTVEIVVIVECHIVHAASVLIVSTQTHSESVEGSAGGDGGDGGKLCESALLD